VLHCSWRCLARASASTPSYLVFSRDLAKSSARLFSGYYSRGTPAETNLTRRANHRHRCIITRYGPRRETGRGLFVSIFRDRAAAAARRSNLFEAHPARRHRSAPPSEPVCRCARTQPAAASHPPERDRVRAPNEPRAKVAPLCRAFHQSRSPRRKPGMAPTAAYLIALALTLLILVILWEGLS